MYQLGMEGKEQAQLIKGGILSFPCHQEAGEDEFCSVEYQQRTEVEIIAHTAGLVVVDGMFLLFSVFPFIMVGIDHTAFSVLQKVGHAFQCPVSQFQG